MERWRKLFRHLHRAALKWSADGAERLAAALAYHSLFSLAPFLMLAVAVFGKLAGHAGTRGRLFASIADLLGDDAARALAPALSAAGMGRKGLWATGFGLAAIFYGSSNVFLHLQDALNSIWGTHRAGGGVGRLIRRRLLSFLLVTGAMAILLSAPVVTAVIAGLKRSHAGSLLVSFATETALFAAIFKALPNARVSWRAAWPGAALTAALFIVGQSVLGFYLGRLAARTLYGAAGSLVVMLVWIYYCAQILLFGAEFVCVLDQGSDSR